MRWLLILLLLLLLWLQFHLWFGEGSLSELHNLRQEIAAQEREIERLRHRNAVLEAEVRGLKEGNEALEERARMELGLIGEGEVFFQIVEPQSGAPATQEVTE